MTTTPKAAEKTDANVETANKSYIKGETVPAQVSSNPVEVVEEPKPTLRERLNGLVHNKRIVAGASSVALIAAAVLVVRKRNASDEVEEENTSA